MTLGMTYRRGSMAQQFPVLLRHIDHLETLARIAEETFWTSARTDWWATGEISNKPRASAQAVCSGAETACNDILQQLALICDVTYYPLDFSGSNKSLYYSTEAGGRPGSVNAICSGLRQRVTELQTLYNNAYSRDSWDNYSVMLEKVYAWAGGNETTGGVLRELGPNFPTLYTAFYTLEDNSASNYDRPRIGIEFKEGDDVGLYIYNVPKYDEGAVSFVQGPESTPPGTAFHRIYAGDTIHIVRLGIEGWEVWEDRMYAVDSVNEYGMVLVAPTDESLVLCETEVAKNFGEQFLIRKVKGATL